MKIDLHVHVSEYSGCAVDRMDDMVRSAIDAGLDAVVLTNHDRLVPVDRLEALNVRYAPFRVFTGCEVSVDDEHVLVIGLHDPALEAVGWRYADLHRFVHARGGYMVLAHPYRFKDDVNLPLDAYPPDAIEVHSTNTGADDEQRIRALARLRRCRLVATSDAHVVDHVGVYHIDLDADPRSDAELVVALQRSEFAIAHVDKRLEAINREVYATEAEIRRLMSIGIDRWEYRRITGRWEGYYDRVAMGKSYRI